MFGSYIKLKVEKEIWEIVKITYGKDDNDRDIAQEVLKTYLSSKKLIKRNKELKRIGDKNSNTIQALRKALDEVHNKYGEMEKIYKKLEKELASAKRNYDNLKREHDALRGKTIIEERIVYKEDKTITETLRKKRDQLQKELWKVRNERDKTYQEKKQIEDKIEKLEKMASDWKRRNFAVLIIGESLQSQEELEEIQLEIINSKDYYEHRANPEKFARLRDLRRQFLIKLIEY